MVMEKGNFVYSGWRANGFVALVGLLVLIAGGIALCVLGSDEMDPRIGLRTAMLVCGACPVFYGGMFCFRGFMLLEPNEARVVMFFGGQIQGDFTKRVLVDQSLSWGARKFRCVPAT